MYLILLDLLTILVVDWGCGKTPFMDMQAC